MFLVGCFRAIAELNGSTPRTPVSVGFPASLYFGHWTLSFKQSSFRPVSQLLQQRLGDTNFASLRVPDRLCSPMGFPIG
jgi:hypothetical protein